MTESEGGRGGEWGRGKGEGEGGGRGRGRGEEPDIAPREVGGEGGGDGVVADGQSWVRVTCARVGEGLGVQDTCDGRSSREGESQQKQTRHSATHIIES